MPSTITCGSCGMQYDGSSLSAGVQFKCTGCGQMVLVGGPAPAGRSNTRNLGAGQRRATAGVGGGVPRGRAMGPAAGGAPGQQPGMPFGAPRKKDNSTLIIVGVIGAVVLGLVIAVAVMASKPSPQQLAKESEDQKREALRKEKADQDAKTKKANDSLEAIYRAAHEMGPKIAAALGAREDTGFFKDNVDWGVMAARHRDDIEKNKDFLHDSLYSSGSWVKEDKGGKVVHRFVGDVARGPDSLRERFQWYFAFRYAGAEANYEKAVSELEKSGFVMTVGPKRYIGKMLQVSSKAGGKPVSFWCGAEEGTTKVSILWIVDPSAREAIQKKESPHERKVRPEDDPQNPGPDRDPTNPDRDPINPPRPDPGTDPDNTLPNELPDAVKTGDQPPAGVLTNVLRDIRDGKSLTEAQVKSVQNESIPKADKKKFIGAVIDLLIDMRAKNDRAGVVAASTSLYRIYKNIVPRDRDDYVYDYQMTDLAENDWPIRAWYEFYTRYKT